MSSLKERAAARRRALEQEKSFVLPLVGYEDIFAVRYRALTLEETLKLDAKSDEIADDTERGLARAADLIINGCLEFLEVKGKDGEGKPVYASLGHTWTASMAHELFDVEFPIEKPSARDAVFGVFSGPQGTARLAIHAKAYDNEMGNALTAVDDEVSGESEPSEEG